MFLLSLICTYSPVLRGIRLINCKNTSKKRFTQFPTPIFLLLPHLKVSKYIFFRDNRATIHKNKKDDDCNRPVLVYGRPAFRLLINPLKAQLFFLVYYPMINVTGIFGKRNSNFKKRARVRSKWECIVFPLNLGKSIFSRPV